MKEICNIQIITQKTLLVCGVIYRDVLPFHVYKLKIYLVTLSVIQNA
jgi:hypothetical protein